MMDKKKLCYICELWQEGKLSDANAMNEVAAVVIRNQSHYERGGVVFKPSMTILPDIPDTNNKFIDRAAALVIKADKLRGRREI